MSCWVEDDCFSRWRITRCCRVDCKCWWSSSLCHGTMMSKWKEGICVCPANGKLNEWSNSLLWISCWRLDCVSHNLFAECCREWKVQRACPPHNPCATPSSGVFFFHHKTGRGIIVAFKQEAKTWMLTCLLLVVKRLLGVSSTVNGNLNWIRFVSPTTRSHLRHMNVVFERWRSRCSYFNDFLISKIIEAQESIQNERNESSKTISTVILAVPLIAHFVHSIPWRASVLISFLENIF